jgi:hypothetical protein
MGSRAGLDVMARRKGPCRCQESNPVRSARSLLTMLTELRQLLLNAREAKGDSPKAFQSEE